MGKTVAVIGAGIGGIAVSIRLALKGYQVEVFEKNAYFGGKLSEIAVDDFRFDAGPSLFTMPQWVDELYTLAGKNPRQYYSYLSLEESCRYFYEDGTRIHGYTDVEKLGQEIATKTGSNAKEIQHFFKSSATIYDITSPVFLQKSLHRLGTYLNVQTIKSIFRLGEIDAFRSMHSANSEFFSDQKIVQLFDRYATYNGSDPYQSPATLNIIPHLEHSFGAYFPTGGMYRIAAGLKQLAEEVGVTFHFEKPVEQILFTRGKVNGIQVASENIEKALVVSNSDVYATYAFLLRDQVMAFKLKEQERSSAALIFYWGIDGVFNALGLHNIFFSQNYAKEFRSIFNDKEVFADPTVYINISSKYKASDAPEGKENWFVMINVPNDTGQDWQKISERAKDAIILKLNRMLKTNLHEKIIAEKILDPQGIFQKTGSFRGSLYGASSNGRFAAFLRHPNFTRKYKNLFFCGGSVHPGGGIPLALLSAKVVSEQIPDAG